MVDDPSAFWARRDAGLAAWAEGLGLSACRHKSQILRRIKRLAGEHCSGRAMHWLSTPGSKTKRLELSSSADGRTPRGHPAIVLRGLDRLADEALLTFVVSVRRRPELQAYTAAITGTCRATGRAWEARVDLTSRAEGRGPCSHARLHAHVGEVGKEAAQVNRASRSLP